MAEIKPENLFEPEYVTVQSARNLAMNEKIREMKAEGQEVYNGCLGQSPFPIPQVGLDALSNYASQNLYEAVLGIKPLREKIIELHGHQTHFTEDRCIVSPGCKELAWLLFHVQSCSVAEKLQFFILFYLSTAIEQLVY